MFNVSDQITPCTSGCRSSPNNACGRSHTMAHGPSVRICRPMLPSIADVGIIGRQILTDGPWAIVWLRPQALFGLDLHPLVHGVIWSLTLNILAYIGFSLWRKPTS